MLSGRSWQRAVSRACGGRIFSIRRFGRRRFTLKILTVPRPRFSRDLAARPCFSPGRRQKTHFAAYLLYDPPLYRG